MTNREILLLQIQGYLGTPYLWAGDNPVEGFDCSGLCLELLNSMGLGPFTDTNAQGIYNFYAAYKLQYPTFGSLVFYGEQTNRITHVAFSLSDKLIFEAGGGGSKTTSRQAAADMGAYCRVRPVNRRKDIVGIVQPPWPFD